MNWFRTAFDPATASDLELAERLRSGDEACWHELYRRHQGRLYRYALRMSGSTATADEITQETFVTFLEQSGRYDAAQSPLAAWLLGIARNRLRKAYASTEPWDPIDDSPIPAPEHDPLAALTHAERLASVRAAVQALPPAFREVVLLIEFEELSYEATAVVIGVPMGTVRSRLHRARGLLMQALAAQRVVQ
ncbi:MAG: sigma-70 family RNA polymerase sigma factor [Acidobacteriota bacterium]